MALQQGDFYSIGHCDNINYLNKKQSFLQSSAPALDFFSR